jgi:hypothetical protein
MIITLSIIVIAIIGVLGTIIAVLKAPFSDIDEDGNKPIG